MDAQRVDRLADDLELVERVDAFVARFGRLQDTLGDKVLVAYLVARGERSAAFVENLDRAEKPGTISGAQIWLKMRCLRDQMIHAYVEETRVLASALGAAHGFVPTLAAVTAWFQVRTNGV